MNFYSECLCPLSNASSTTSLYTISANHVSTGTLLPFQVKYSSTPVGEGTSLILCGRKFVISYWLTIKLLKEGTASVTPLLGSAPARNTTSASTGCCPAQHNLSGCLTADSCGGILKFSLRYDGHEAATISGQMELHTID